MHIKFQKKCKIFMFIKTEFSYSELFNVKIMKNPNWTEKVHYMRIIRSMRANYKRVLLYGYISGFLSKFSV